MAFRKIAAELIETHGTCNPFLICENLNIKVKYQDLDEVKGFATEVLGRPFIFLNNGLQGFSQRFVLAHELYHIICHDIQDINFWEMHTLQNVQKFEDEANDFALALLLDSQTGSYLIGEDPLDDEVERVIAEAGRRYR